LKAHIDYPGLFPKLVSEDFTEKIICTDESKILAEILLDEIVEIYIICDR